MRYEFSIKIEAPEGVGKEEMKEYIKDAVGSWCKGMNPEHPIFDIDRDTITVKSRDLIPLDLCV